MLNRTDTVMSDTTDVVYRMAFHATNHPVQMHAKVWVSTRALVLAGYNPEVRAEVGKWLNEIYQKYFGLRAAIIGAPDTIVLDPSLVTYDKLLSVLQGFCEVLRLESVVQKDWVVMDFDKWHLDSRQLGISKKGW